MEARSVFPCPCLCVERKQKAMDLDSCTQRDLASDCASCRAGGAGLRGFTAAALMPTEVCACVAPWPTSPSERGQVMAIMGYP